jgi:hypothetical protein
MPPPRRGRSSRTGRAGALSPPELRGTLGTLLRTTLAQASAVRDALERGAREGRARIDDALHERRRQEALAALGEIALDRLRKGELAELEAVPEAADVIAELEDLDSRHEPPARRAREWVSPPARSRFDRGRGRDADADAEAAGDGTVSSASWQPPAAKEPAARVWRPDQAPPSQKKGGINFNAPDDDDGDEDDLAAYMHPDDVPSRK